MQNIFPTDPNSLTNRLIPFQQAGWSGWVNEQWADFPGFKNLDSWLEGKDGDLILDTLCRRIVRHGTKYGYLYSKLMRAQNDGVIQKHERFSIFKWKFYPSRARAIVKTTAAMLAKGHHCPRPVLGIRKSASLPLPMDLYVATEIPDPTVEERLLNADTQADQYAILEICGKELARFHRDGFVHGDFLPRNTCLNLDNTLFSYLDNDRTRRWPNTPIFHFKRRNLTQFCFNLYVLGFHDNPALEEAFLGAYAKEAGWSPARLQDETRTIRRQNGLRWNKLDLKKRHK